MSILENRLNNWILTKLNSFCQKWFSQIEKTKKDYENIIIGGDFNIIPDEIDVYNHKMYLNDALFKLEIRKKLRELINLGFYDIYRYFNNQDDLSLILICDIH